MRLVKRKTLPAILAVFNRTLSDLDKFNEDQALRAELALVQNIKLSELQAEQAGIIDDAHEQIRAATAVRAKIAALLE